MNTTENDVLDDMNPREHVEQILKAFEEDANRKKERPSFDTSTWSGWFYNTLYWAYECKF